jgi:hypothetical protein
MKKLVTAVALIALVFIAYSYAFADEGDIVFEIDDPI